jgi:hypothetical protein
MSEMVEKVARALSESRRRDGLATWEDQARAAIAGMREPTRSMKSAAVMDADDEWHFGPHEARECWQAMIDAALTEPVSADSNRQSDAGSISTEPQ